MGKYKTSSTIGNNDNSVEAFGGPHDECLLNHCDQEYLCNEMQLLEICGLLDENDDDTLSVIFSPTSSSLSYSSHSPSLSSFCSSSSCASSASSTSYSPSALHSSSTSYSSASSSSRSFMRENQKDRRFTRFHERGASKKDFFSSSDEFDTLSFHQFETVMAFNRKSYSFSANIGCKAEYDNVCVICSDNLSCAYFTGMLNSCKHQFCFECIKKWAEVTNLCPLCKREFLSIKKYRKNHGSPSQYFCELVHVERKTLRVDSFDDPDVHTVEYGGCELCGEDNDWQSMLLCDGCDKGFHIFCLNPRLDAVPPGNWYCPSCSEILTNGGASSQIRRFSSNQTIAGDIPPLNTVEESVSDSGHISNIPKCHLISTIKEITDWNIHSRRSRNSQRTTHTVRNRRRIVLGSSDEESQEYKSSRLRRSVCASTRQRASRNLSIKKKKGYRLSRRATPAFLHCNIGCETDSSDGASKLNLRRNDYRGSLCSVNETSRVSAKSSRLFENIPDSAIGKVIKQHSVLAVKGANKPHMHRRLRRRLVRPIVDSGTSIDDLFSSPPDTSVEVDSLLHEMPQTTKCFRPNSNITVEGFTNINSTSNSGEGTVPFSEPIRSVISEENVLEHRTRSGLSDYHRNGICNLYDDKFSKSCGNLKDKKYGTDLFECFTSPLTTLINSFPASGLVKAVDKLPSVRKKWFF